MSSQKRWNSAEIDYEEFVLVPEEASVLVPDILSSSAASDSSSSPASSASSGQSANDPAAAEGIFSAALHRASA
jgi:hypothetical protein